GFHTSSRCLSFRLCLFSSILLFRLPTGRLCLGFLQSFHLGQAGRLFFRLLCRLGFSLLPLFLLLTVLLEMLHLLHPSFAELLRLRQGLFEGVQEASDVGLGQCPHVGHPENALRQLRLAGVHHVAPVAQQVVQVIVENALRQVEGG